MVRIYGEQDAELLPSVLLSLSGEEGYRNNSISGSGGTFSFGNLFPGSFYLRPLLKVSLSLSLSALYIVPCLLMSSKQSQHTDIRYYMLVNLLAYQMSIFSEYSFDANFIHSY